MNQDLAYRLGRDQPGAWSELTELLRRDWAVRVLDAWAAQAERNESRRYSVSQCKDEVLDTFEHWYCDLQGSTDIRRIVHEPTTDAARLAGAEAVWPELPESVRAELGERP